MSCCVSLCALLLKMYEMSGSVELRKHVQKMHTV